MAFTDQNLIEFFKQRMVEVYDRNTLDSYSVRSCNTMSMFYELKDLLKGWIRGNVKRGSTVALCIDELMSLLKEDEWIDCSFYDKAKLMKQLEDYGNRVNKIKENKDKTDSDNLDAKFMVHLATSCIAENEKKYLQSLLAAINTDLLTPATYDDSRLHDVVGSLDRKLSLLATELLRRGYSQSYLYFYFKSMKSNAASVSFSTAFAQMQTELGAATKNSYVVILRLNFKGNNIPTMDNMKEEPTTLLAAMDARLKTYVKKDPRRRYYIVKVKAADGRSALHEARLLLFQSLDRNDIGDVQILNPGIVSYMKNGSRHFSKEMYQDSGRGHNAAKLATVMNDIDAATGIAQEIKDRLNTALRHLRVGDNQIETEQRFLNYWIGLEFIFATPKSDSSTFLRLMERFPQMKTLYYLNRNVKALDDILKGKGVIGSHESFGSMTDAERDTAFTNATDFLLKYRIKRMKSHLHDRHKVEAYLNKHSTNLEWHISRIYHLRNELVHEAALKQSIDGVGVNLRSYLVYMLNLLLDYCSKQLQNLQKDQVAMDNFFWHYELLWKKLTPEYEKEGFLSLGLPEELVK